MPANPSANPSPTTRGIHFSLADLTTQCQMFRLFIRKIAAEMDLITHVEVEKRLLAKLVVYISIYQPCLHVQGRMAPTSERRKALHELSENSIRNQSSWRKYQGNLDRNGLHMAAQYARFIFAWEELVGKSILNCLSL